MHHKIGSFNYVLHNFKAHFLKIVFFFNFLVIIFILIFHLISFKLKTISQNWPELMQNSQVQITDSIIQLKLINPH